MKSHLLELLAERVLVFDGAMGTQLQNSNLSDADFVLPAQSQIPEVRAAAARIGAKPLDGCNELLSLTRPDVVVRPFTFQLFRGRLGHGGNKHVRLNLNCSSRILDS